MTAEKITQGTEGLNVPNEPIIPFIIGDGIGPDIWKAASRVIDAAVEKAYNGEKRIEWKEVLAGQKAFDTTGEWLPQETLDTIKEYLIAVKGPLTTPIGGGIRSISEWNGSWNITSWPQTPCLIRNCIYSTTTWWV